MSGMAWGKFFWSDYASDPALKICSFAAQGLWMRMLCIMAEHDPVGWLAVNGAALDNKGIARMTGGALDEVEELVSELHRNGVFSRDRRGWIYSRRMISDAKKRKQASEDGSTGGNPKLTAGYNKPGFIYLVGPRRDGAYKIGISINPENRLRKLRDKFRGHDLVLVGAWPCDDMGALEAEILGTFDGDKRQGEWLYLSHASLRDLIKKLSSDKGQGKLPLKGQTKPHMPEARVQSKKTSKDVQKNSLPDDWKPEPFGAGTKCRQIVDSWSHDEHEMQVERFKAHHERERSRFESWQAAWKTWVLNSVAFRRGGGSGGSSEGGSFLDHYVKHEMAGAGR